MNNIISEKNKKRYLPHDINIRKYAVEKILKEMGIKHHKIQPRTPQHNGKVERSHRNDNERFYSYLKFYSIDDLREQGKRYLKRSNNIPMAVHMSNIFLVHIDFWGLVWYNI